MRWLRCAGSTKKLSIRLKINTEMTTAGNSRKILPITPGTKNIGLKAAMVVRMAKVTGTAISLAPRIDASSLPMPRCMWPKAFSPTTMASSTTMPSVMIRAKSVIMLIDRSSPGISRKAPMKEMGMPRDTQNDSRGSRNRARMMMTSTPPSLALRTSRSMRPASTSD